ncbi:DUF2169 domain-containing protein [Vibrio rotiferianus]
MKFVNATPFPGESWSSFDHKGFLFQTTLIRLKYRLILEGDSSATLKLDSNQGDLWAEDIYWGESGNSSIRYPSDYVTYKPLTDIILNARTYSPNSVGNKSWKTGISLRSRENIILDVKAEVFSPRQWKRDALIGWYFDKSAELITDLALRYEYAFGGSHYKEESGDSEAKLLCMHNANPVGVGLLHEHLHSAQPIPQICCPESRPNMESPYEKLHVVGFGAIDNHWDGRIEHAGTYDEKWLKERFPMPPSDFEPLYNQQAHPNLRVSVASIEECEFSLKNMFVGHPLCKWKVPLQRLYRFYPKSKQRAMLPVDTVVIDIESENSNEWCVYVSYRLYEKRPLKEDLLQVVLEQGVTNG